MTLTHKMLKGLLFAMFVLLAAFVLTSCTGKWHNVKVGNALVRAYDEYGKPYKSGDSVCIKQTSGLITKSDWIIINEPTWKNGIWFADSSILTIEHRIGYIQ